MQIYLWVSSIPELASLPANERRIAWHTCRERTKKHWQTWVGTLFAALTGLASGLGSLWAVVNYVPAGRMTTYFIGGFVCGAIIVGVTEYLRSIVVASQIRPYLREYLRERAEWHGGDDSGGG